MGVSLDGTAGRKPSGPSMFGKKDISEVPEVGGTIAAKAVTMVAESASRRHSTVFAVFESAAHWGTASTKAFHVASFRSGPNVGKNPVDSAIYVKIKEFKIRFCLLPLLEHVIESYKMHSQLLGRDLLS